MRKLILITVALAGLVVAGLALATTGAPAPQLTPVDLPMLGIAGMLVNRENVSEVFRNIRATFNRAMETAETQWMHFATQIDTNQLVEEMDWISAFPGWRQWVGDKVVRSLAAHNYKLSLVEYETTVGVKKRDLEADRLGIYRQKAASYGELAAYFPDELCADALNNAFTNTCYDAKAYFATDHPLTNADGQTTTFSNKGAAALSASTQAAAIASLGAGLKALRTMKNNEGRPVRVRDIRLVVPPALADVANVLNTNDRLEDGKPNPYKGVVRVLVWNELTSDTAWFLMGTAGGLNPLVYLVRKAPQFTQVTDLSDASVFKSGEFLFGGEADAVVGYSFPQLAYGSTGAG